ncbi:ATP-binding cassette domain-containing protein [Nocardiopsis changdeensis]|uniref:ATP-binding cassette domain-containing protein n=1 Tax=Nocardiopsis changdeensis TaxID=2831969 RepID=A0ABX8BIU1_9ACTN|nr:ATP-binding cassette domain-containing protein [Nocardiopsis changdeensis]
MTGSDGRPAVLRLDGVTRSFGDLVALDGVDLSVTAGEIHCVLGENGAGKSTLCNIVFGGTPPLRGRMLLDGEPYAPASPADAARRGIAMVHQHFSLVPTLTVEQNLLLGRSRFRPDRRALRRRLERIGEEYGLAVDPGARVDRMSVGHRQTAEIVKALVDGPRLVLFDEPTGVLGPREIDAFLATARRIADSGTAVVLITHKLQEVRAVGDRATVLRHGRVTGGGRLADLADDDLVSLMVGRAPRDPASAAALGLRGGAGARGAGRPDRPPWRWPGCAPATPTGRAPSTASTSPSGPGVSPGSPAWRATASPPWPTRSRGRSRSGPGRSGWPTATSPRPPRASAPPPGWRSSPRTATTRASWRT